MCVSVVCVRVIAYENVIVCVRVWRMCVRVWRMCVRVWCMCVRVWLCVTQCGV